MAANVQQKPSPWRAGPMLADICGGRDNNLNLIRMIAASAVLVSHAFPISLGSGAVEPLDPYIDRSLGSVAVVIFFAISGFLIARSFDRRKDGAEWMSARFMRLWPGLMVVLALTLFVLGPIVTQLPLATYFEQWETLTYALRNLTLASLQYGLPGVFEDNPYGTPINGSLWTLIHEVVCYAGVFVAGAIGLLRARLLFSLLFAIYLAIYCLYDLIGPLHSKIDAFHDLSYPFVIGCLFYVWRDYIRLNYGACVGFAALAWAAHSTPLFEAVFVAWLCYATFVVAYLPAGGIRRYNGFGDYSYGMYIYAFPVQQTTMHFAGDISPYANIAIALPITLAFAVASWMLVEKPALDRRHAVANGLRYVAARARGRQTDRSENTPAA